MNKILSAGLIVIAVAFFIAGCTEKKEETQKTELTAPASPQAQPSTPMPAATSPPKEVSKPEPATGNKPPAATAPATTPAPAPAPVATSQTPAPPAPSTSVSGNAEKGALVFKNSCQACHGQGGDAGNKGGIKTAANFANLDANNVRIKDLLLNLTVADHIKIVKLGGTKSGVKGAGAAMAGFGTVLKEDQIMDVVAYERTLPAFKNSPK